MNHSKVLVDSYSVGNSSKIRVLGRYNHQSSTEIDIERTVEFKAQSSAVNVAQYFAGFDLMSEEKFDPAQNYEAYHAPLNAQQEIKTRKYEF